MKDMGLDKGGKLGLGRFITDDQILEVQRSTDIVDLISEYIPLKKAGANYKALCPFHDEKTPSFMVSSSKQIYHCFGCHKGGNIFTFLMAWEKVNFIDAVKLLAERSGIKLFFKEPEETSAEAKRAELLKTNRLITDYYHRNLIDSGDAGARSARAYLKRRGFSQGFISRFLLGYAPDGWEHLINFARSQDIKDDCLTELGLILPRKDGQGYYDRFRHRLIFPIFNTHDRVIGFGARALDKTEPVYLNSPEGALFSKGKTLYGLNFAKESVAKSGRLAIVEGYTDVIMAHQSGFEWVAATLGTALTEYHIRLIRRFVNKVVLVYDRDQAGEIASNRTLDLFLAEEIDLLIAQLPEGLDPYDCLVQKGVETFRKSLGAAQDLFSYRLETVKAKYNLSNFNEKAQAIDEILDTVRAVPNIIRRDLMIKKLSEETHTRETFLRMRLKEKRTGRQVVPGESADSFTSLYRLNEIKAAEDMIELMLTHNELIPQAKERLAPEDLSDESLNRITRELFQLYEKYDKVNHQMLVALLSPEPELANRVVEILQRAATQTQTDYKKYFEECLSFFTERRRRLKDESRLKERLKDAERKGDKKEIDFLLSEFMKLRKMHGVVSRP